MPANEILTLSTRRFTAWQVGAVSLLVAVALINYLLPALFPGHLRVIGLFDVGMEISLPNWFSVINLFVAGLLLAIVYADVRHHRERDAVYWLLLTIVFFYLSIDEGAHVHEKAARITIHLADMMSLLPAEGAGNWASRSWVVIAFPIVVLFGLIYVPFLLRLRRSLALLMVLAGVVYVGGALVMEAVGGVMLYYGWHSNDLLYEMRRILEEGGEMYGIVLFNCAIYGELARRRVALALGER